MQPLIDALSSMVSQGASNRKSDLHRMIRKQTIQGNVKKANDIRVEIGNYLSEVCEDYGCNWINFEDTLFV